MIQIKRIEPQGYCNGVRQALELVYQAIENKDLPRPITLLGQLIHNKHVISNLIEKGVQIVEGKSKTRIELLDQIQEGTVILSAHGVSPRVIEKAQNKGLTILDASCGNVLVVHKRILEHLRLGYTCLYVGTKHHPECEGVLGISPEIKFISSIDDIDILSISSEKIYVTNQTTLSKYDLEEIYTQLKKKYPKIKIDDKICNATTVRQEAMANQEQVDLCIVVGDLSSSNTKKLALVSETKAKIPTILCEDLKSLNTSKLKDITSVSISSGTSTPKEIVDEIIEYIQTL